MRAISTEGVRACVVSSRRLLEDAFVVSSVTRSALIELSLEELYKAWLAFFALYPEIERKELEDFNPRRELLEHFANHDMKIKRLQDIMNYLVDHSRSHNINKKAAIKAAESITKKSSDSKAEEKLAIIRLRNAMKDDQKTKRLIQLIIEPIASIGITKVKGLRVNSLYADIENENLIEPHEPNDYSAISGIVLFDIMSYAVLGGEYMITPRLLELIRKDRRVRQVIDSELGIAGIHL